MNNIGPVRRYGGGLISVGLIGLACGCASAPASTPASIPMHRVIPPQRALVDDTCRLARVTGDSRMVATADGRVIVIGGGLGIMQSIDGGFSFDSIARREGLEWPSIAAEGRDVWVSWIERRPAPRVVVAAVGQELGPPVVAFSSSTMLIDSELVAIGGGRLLLFVTEVDGLANANQAQYTVRCFGSVDRGLNWEERSQAVTGPFGVNVEDPRAVTGSDGSVVLAYEWETEERGSSKILVQVSNDEGFSWDSASILWGGDLSADCEPGGFVTVGRDLWFVASTDHEDFGASYAGARIAMIRSSDGGRTWGEPRTLIQDPDQISMGGITLEGVVILPSIRRYVDNRERFLAFYRVDSIGRWPLPCGVPKVFFTGFESGEPDDWDKAD